jgi:hypothetical protein
VQLSAGEAQGLTRWALHNSKRTATLLQVDAVCGPVAAAASLDASAPAAVPLQFMQVCVPAWCAFGRSAEAARCARCRATAMHACVHSWLLWIAADVLRLLDMSGAVQLQSTPAVPPPHF